MRKIALSLVLCLALMGDAWGQTLIKAKQLAQSSLRDSLKTIRLPDTTFSATTTPGGTAHRVIIGSLRDAVFVGESNPVARIRQLEKNASWYASLGPFPMDYAIHITIGQDTISIIDRQKGTIWRRFGTGSGKYFGTGGVLRDIKFEDMKLYVAENSLNMIDFLKDRGYVWTTSGFYIQNNSISNSESGGGTTLLNSTPAIANNTVNAVAVVRDPNGGVDEFARFQHRIAVVYNNTGVLANQAISVSDAGISNIYNGLNWLPNNVFLEPGDPGSMFIATKLSTTVYEFGWRRNIATVYANAWEPERRIGQQGGAGSGSENLPNPVTNITRAVAAISHASIVGNQSPVMIGGTDLGLAVIHTKKDDYANGLALYLDATRNSPAWSATADSLGWSFESAVDTTNVWGKKIQRVGDGSGVTFGVKGVIGLADSITGSDLNGFFIRSADPSVVITATNFSAGIWIKKNNAATGYVLSTERLSTSGWSLYVDNTVHLASSQALVRQDIYSGTATVGTAGTQWNFAVVTKSGTTGNVYIDGNLVASGTVQNPVASVDTLFIGNRPIRGAPYAGCIDQAFIIKRALSSAEIRWLYQQGLHGLQSSVDPNDALHANNVDFVSVDPNGRWIAAGNQDSVTILDEFMIPKYRYGTPNGTLKSAALWTDAGSDSLSYALGTSTRLKLQQTDLRIAELARQGGGNADRGTWYMPFYGVAPEDSGFTTQGAITITGADSVGKFKYADTSPGNLRVGLSAEVRGSLRYGSASAVGADIAEMFSAPQAYALVIKSLSDPSAREINVPPMIRLSSAIFYDNDSTRSYPFKVIRYEQFQKGRVFIDTGVKGRTGLIPQPIVYTKGVEVGDSLWYKPDSTTTVKIVVTTVMGDTVSLASTVPANTEFAIYPPFLVAKYIQSNLQGGDVVQMGAGKTMLPSSQIGKRAWIVSSSPANILNADIEGIPVALCGTALCRVSYHAVRGGVAVGDALTGGTNGDLVKALLGEPISAWAQEAVSAGTKKISVLVE